jgi:Lon protease-like protein
MRRITALPYAAGVHSPLPLFPLATVLVPGLVMPLHIFEPRYRGLIEELLAIPDEDAREFGIIAVRDGRDVARDGIDALYRVGTATVLRQAERLEDGRFDIITTGTRRFRLHSVDLSEPLIRGEVEFLEDPTVPDDLRAAADVHRRFLAYRQVLSGQVAATDDEIDVDDDDEDLPDDPTVLSYLVTAAMVLPTSERQDLLSAETTGQRLTLARSLLHRETGLISLLGALPAIDMSSPDPTPN